MDHLQDASGTRIYRPRVRLFCTFADVPSPKDASERTFGDFYHLPEKFGWQIDDNCLKTQTWGSYSLDFVVQRWLYFEVLYQVFGHLRTLFDWNDFVHIDSSNRSYVKTSKLPEYLIAWSECEKSSLPIISAERNRRLIRIQQVLDRSRYFVSKCCTTDSPEGNTKWEVNDLLALSLMVLGETLTRAQKLIHRAIDFNIPGWCNPELHSYGWGYSQRLFHELTKEGWCMRAVYRLKALLRGNTIGLMYLYSILRESAPKGEVHKLCNIDECRQEVSRTRNQYHHCLHPKDDYSEKVDHYGAINQPVPCKSDPFRGEVDAAALAAVINQGSIPLFHWDKNNKKLTLVAMNSFSSKSYAVFSHVWADGFGCFDGKNDIPLCVLNMFSNLLTKIATLRDSGPEVPDLFWIDTLCIPESKKFSGERLKAIRQMHNIYTHARYTVVLDQSLMSVEIGSGYSEPAMKITMSNWMTRMWTLQEAVLSKNIYFYFKDRLCPMGHLEELFDDEDRSLHNCLPEVSHLYWKGILGSERQAIRQQVAKKDGWQPKADSLASIWKALQWRSTAHPIHETLSLATMLNADTETFARPTDHKQDTEEYGYECDRRMIELLHRFSKLKHCPIPPGMIFLPGPRLQRKGFGWAPRTWLSSHEIESPDPLSFDNQKGTRLTAEGLEVQFPGFLLHDLGDDRGTWNSREHFCFSTDSSLLQWYRVEPKEGPHFPAGGKLIGKELAIILPRLQLGDLSEIALFVSIQYSRNGVKFAEILNRVLISRIGKQEEWSQKFRTGAKDAMCAGQVLMPDTCWCVDGPFHQEDGIDAHDFWPSANGNTKDNLGLARDAQPGKLKKAWTGLTSRQRSPHRSGRSNIRNFIPGLHRQKESE